MVEGERIDRTPVHQEAPAVPDRLDEARNGHRARDGRQQRSRMKDRLRAAVVVGRDSQERQPQILEPLGQDVGPQTIKEALSIDQKRIAARDQVGQPPRPGFHERRHEWRAVV